jgi:hypothetical protein
MAIESITGITVETVREFLPRIYAGWFKLHHPQGAQSVFIAALALLHLPASQPEQTGLEELKDMMRIQSRRWHIAGRSLDLIHHRPSAKFSAGKYLKTIQDKEVNLRNSGNHI